VDGSLAETVIAVNLEAGAAKPPPRSRLLARAAESQRAVLPSS